MAREAMIALKVAWLAVQHSIPSCTAEDARVTWAHAWRIEAYL